jgi:hypothetical protein
MEPGRHGQINHPADGPPRQSSHRRPRTGMSELENSSEVEKTLSRGWLFNLFFRFFSVAFGAWVIAASFSATTRADSSGFSAPKHCGSWSWKEILGNKRWTMMTYCKPRRKEELDSTAATVMANAGSLVPISESFSTIRLLAPTYLSTGNVLFKTNTFVMEGSSPQ